MLFAVPPQEAEGGAHQRPVPALSKIGARLTGRPAQVPLHLPVRLLDHDAPGVQGSAILVRMTLCPSCGGERRVKNGLTRHGKQSYRCKACGRQWSDQPTNKRISNEQKALVDRLLLEKLSLAGIARALGVSEAWLQGYVNRSLAAVPRRIDVPAKARAKRGRS